MEEVDPGWRKQYIRRLGLGRTSYYVQPTKQAARDQQALTKLQAAHELHPFYGVARLALHLGWNQKKTRRIRTLAGVVVPTPTKKRRNGRAGKAEIAAPLNILQRYAKFRSFNGTEQPSGEFYLHYFPSQHVRFRDGEDGLPTMKERILSYAANHLAKEVRLTAINVLD